MPDHSPRQPRYGRRVRGFRYDRPRHKRESGRLHRRRPPQTARRGGDAGVRTGPSRFGLKVRKGGLAYCQLPKQDVAGLIPVSRFRINNLLRSIFAQDSVYSIKREMLSPSAAGSSNPALKAEDIFEVLQCVFH